MNKQIYIGNTPLIDLTGYATESYVDTAVSNVDVTDQLSNYVLKTSLDASIDAVDASIQNSDASISAIKTTLADIVSDGSVDEAINTWNEMKQFLADYTTASDLSTLINSVKNDAVADASADAAGKYQPIGAYLVADDISTFVDAADVASAINSSITALDLANTYQPIGNYLTNDDISTFITADDISTLVSQDDISTFITADDISTFVTDSSLTTNYYQKGAVNDMLEVISNSINKLSSDVAGKVGSNDISTFVNAGDVATAINSSISALNLSQYAKDASLADYAKSTDIASTYMTINDASNHVQSSDVEHIVTCTSTAYAAIEIKDSKTIYIVTE